MYRKNEVNYIQDWWCGLLGIVDKQWIVIPLPEEQDCHARTEINVSVVACLPFSAYHVIMYREGYIFSRRL